MTSTLHVFDHERYHFLSRPFQHRQDARGRRRQDVLWSQASCTNRFMITLCRSLLGSSSNSLFAARMRSINAREWDKGYHSVDHRGSNSTGHST